MAMASRVRDQAFREKYPANPPRILPIVQLMAVEARSNPNVQGKAVPMRALTRVGKLKNDTPKSPRNSLPQNATYCSPQEPCKPYISVRSWMMPSIAPGSSVDPWALI